MISTDCFVNQQHLTDIMSFLFAFVPYSMTTHIFSLHYSFISCHYLFFTTSFLLYLRNQILCPPHHQDHQSASYPHLMYQHPFPPVLLQ